MNWYLYDSKDSSFIRCYSILIHTYILKARQMLAIIRKCDLDFTIYQEMN